MLIALFSSLLSAALVALGAAVGAGPVAAHTPLACLTARVSNLRAGRGSCSLALFEVASADAFPRQSGRAVRTVRVAVAALAPGGTAGRVFFNGLPPGTYALAVFQDENNNNKLDTNILHIPTERYGFSNGAHGLLGPPSFRAARFVVSAADTTVTVRLR